MPNPFLCDWNSLKGKFMPALTPATSIIIDSSDGQGFLAACYLPNGGSVECNTLRPAFDHLRVPKGVLPHHVSIFHARGLVTGDRIWLEYLDKDGSTAKSARVQVHVTAFDHHQGTDALADNPDLSFILLDSYGYSQRAGGYIATLFSWREQVNAVLKNIYSHPLGKSLLKAVGDKYPQKTKHANLHNKVAAHLPAHVVSKQIDPSGKLIIRPYLGDYPNADSGISFSPDVYFDDGMPASSPVEALFHELTHLADGEFWGYEDAEGFEFDGADFLSITATNVFSSSLNRTLRKDHHGKKFMPVKFASDPAQFAKSFHKNMKLASQKAPAFYRALSHFNRPGLWNPFVPHPSDSVPLT